MNGVEHQLNLSQLPVPPKEEDSSSFKKKQTVALIVPLSFALLILFGVLVLFISRRTMRRWRW